jgi:REP element-mobilizing transposase RayT
MHPEGVQDRKRDVGSTFYNLHYHIVFSTKDRRPVIGDGWRSSLHQYLGGTVRGLRGVAGAVGGINDHVHLLVSLTTSHVVADFMRELKKASSVWVKDRHEASFVWQEGYAVFTVSWTHVPVIQRYISDQATHHRKRRFVDELKRLLDKNGVRYDHRYLL